MVDSGAAQSRTSNTVSVSFQGTSLDKALEYVSGRTGTTIAYESEIVEGLKTFCIADRETIDRVLSCILKDTGLDYFRLSSGAYVLARSAQQSPLYGYLKGIVMDDGTGIPLSNASVVLDNRNVGAATNDVGQFVLPPLLPGRYGLTVSHISYKPWRGVLDVGPGLVSSARIAMEAKVHLVSPIIVDGSSLSGWISTGSMNSTSGLDDAVSGGGTEAFRNLNELAGVSINDVTADIRVDGSSAGEMMMKLDGVPVFLPRTNIVGIGPFSTLAIDRFTVQRSGFGVRSGSYVTGVVEAQHNLSADGLSHLQVDPSGVNARLRFGSAAKGTSGMVAGRFGLWQVFAPSRLSDVLADWSAADPFLLVAPTRQYEYATDAFITDSLGLRVNLRPSVRYNDLHSTMRLALSPLRYLDASIYLGTNSLQGNRISETQSLAFEGASETSDLSIGDDYRWLNANGRVRYSTFVGNRTLVQMQAKLSNYALQHSYRLIENLNLGAIRDNAAQPSPTSRAIVADDDNHVLFGGLSASFEHARTDHQFGFGIDADLVRSRLTLRASGEAELSIPTPADAIVALRSQALNWADNAAFLSLFAEDRWEPTSHVRVIAGVRSTLVTSQAKVYAEPKLSVQLRGRTPIGNWGTESTAGVYRQYLVQADLSKLNAGSLLPEIRVWIPVDESVGPPTSYNLSQTVSLIPTPGVTISGEGYARYLTSGLALDYSNLTTFEADASNQSADQLLTSVRGRTMGVAIMTKIEKGIVSGSARYAFTDSYREGEYLLGGVRTSVPNVDPHELNVNVSVRPTPGFTTRIAWRRSSGRAFGFTSAYYDYFGNSSGFYQHESIDFRDPDSHVLPVFSQVDVSVATARRIGNIGVQLRADIMNALDRSNVAEWRITYEDGDLQKTPKPLYPRVTTLSLRLSW